MVFKFDFNVKQQGILIFLLIYTINYFYYLYLANVYANIENKPYPITFVKRQYDPTMSDSSAANYAKLMKDELDRMKCTYPTKDLGNRNTEPFVVDINQLGTPIPPSC
jgi:hypothetical protein